ncbi:TON1B [Scenedesmus sp. PABB004]|nr:TON1B [Scenedesmus sp. PABB004]
MDLELVKQRVAAALDGRGVLARLKAELRANVFAAIHDQDVALGGGGLGGRPDAAARGEAVLADPAGAAAAALVGEFMVCAGLRFTQQVYEPEMGLPPAAWDRAALREQLGLEEDDGRPLLAQLLGARLGGAPPAPAPLAEQASAEGGLIPAHAPDSDDDAAAAAEEEEFGAQSEDQAEEDQEAEAEYSRLFLEAHARSGREASAGSSSGGSGGSSPRAAPPARPVRGAAAAPAAATVAAAQQQQQQQEEEEGEEESCLELASGSAVPSAPAASSPSAVAGALAPGPPAGRLAALEPLAPLRSNKLAPLPALKAPGGLAGRASSEGLRDELLRAGLLGGGAAATEADGAGAPWAAAPPTSRPPAATPAGAAALVFGIAAGPESEEGGSESSDDFTIAEQRQLLQEARGQLPRSGSGGGAGAGQPQAAWAPPAAAHAGAAAEGGEELGSSELGDVTEDISLPLEGLDDLDCDEGELGLAAAAFAARPGALPAQPAPAGEATGLSHDSGERSTAGFAIDSDEF